MVYFMKLLSQVKDRCRFISTHVPNDEYVSANSYKDSYIGLATQALIALFIFLIPFPHTTAIRNICIYLSFLLFALNAVRHKKRICINTPLLVPFSLFLCWGIISTVLSNYKLDSSHDLYAHLIFYIVYYYILINTFTEKIHVIILSCIILLSGTIFSSGALLHFYYYLGHSIQIRLGQGLGHLYATNVIGYLLVMSAIFSIRMSIDTKNLFYRYAFILAGIISGYASILTYSRGNYLAFMAAMGILLIRRKKLLVSGIGILLIAVVFIVPSVGNKFVNGVFEDRIVAYFYSLEFIKEHPIAGSGFSTDIYGTENFFHVEEYKAKIPQRYRSVLYVWPPHNMLLFIAVRLGLIGLILFTFILFKSVSMCLNLARHGKNEFTLNWALCLLAALMVILVKGLFEPMFTHFVDTLFYTILAMITILWNLNYSQAQKS